MRRKRRKKEFSKLLDDKRGAYAYQLETAFECLRIDHHDDAGPCFFHPKTERKVGTPGTYIMFPRDWISCSTSPEGAVSSRARTTAAAAEQKRRNQLRGCRTKGQALRTLPVPGGPWMRATS